MFFLKYPLHLVISSSVFLAKSEDERRQALKISENLVFIIITPCNFVTFSKLKL